MLACFVSPVRSRVAFQVLVPGSLSFFGSGLFFVTECAVEKRFEQIAVELERFVETVETATVVAFFEPGDAEIVKILRRGFTAVNRLIEFFNRLVQSTLR